MTGCQNKNLKAGKQSSFNISSRFPNSNGGNIFMKNLKTQTGAVEFLSGRIKTSFFYYEKNVIYRKIFLTISTKNFTKWFPK